MTTNFLPFTLRSLRPTDRRRAPVPVPRPRRDALLRVITLLLGRLLLPAAWLRSRADPRAQATQWALQLRFPHERLAGLTSPTAVALRRARTEAFWDRHLLLGVTSGHRTAGEQDRLLAADLARRGPALGAHPRVLPADQSRHVAGVAVDVRPREAAQWLERTGCRFDLYRTYANEWWHFEHLPQARGRAPRLLAHPGVRGPRPYDTVAVVGPRPASSVRSLAVSS